MSEQANSDATPLPAADRDFTKWILIVLVVAAVASEVVLLRQNRRLRMQAAAEHTSSTDLRKRTDRAAYEATLLSRCRPFGTPDAAAAPRPLDVSIHFAVDRDCSSCIEKTVAVWNEAVRTLPPSVTVRGYTEIDGTLMQKAVDGLKAAFPVTNVPRSSRELGALGVTHTPVVLVSDPATGRILMTHAPVTWEDDDRAFVERVRAAATPCG